MRHLAVVLFLLPISLTALPIVDRDGVRNAASLLAPNLPGGGLSPGCLFVIRGRQLGPIPAAVSKQPVAELGGVRVSISSRTGSWRAELLQASDSEIRAVAPTGVSLGMLWVTVIREGRSSAPVYIKMLPQSVGLFTLSEDGAGPLQKAVVRRGAEVAVRATGLGKGQADVEVFVGGRAARRVKISDSTECCGIGLIRFEVPPEASPGCNVPVQVRSGGAIPSNAGTLNIEPLPRACSDIDETRRLLPQTFKIGFVIPFRLSMLYQADRGVSTEFTGDAVIGAFRGGQLKESIPLFYPPPTGACTVFARAVSGGDPDVGQLSSLLAGTSPLDGGEFEVMLTGGAKKSIPKVPLRDQYEFGVVGGAMFRRRERSEVLFFRPGPVTVQTEGGKDVPRLWLRISFPQPIVWTNRRDAETVDRARDLDVHWDVGNVSQPVVIAGFSWDKPGSAASGFLCVARATDRRFRVPPPILQFLPVSRTGWHDSLAYLMVATVPNADVLFHVAGLDRMFAVGVSADGRTVRFR